MCPFQTLHWRHAGAGGIRQSTSGAEAANSPLAPYSANTLLRTGDVTLDDHGAITGNFRFVMSGQEALSWRQAHSDTTLTRFKNDSTAGFSPSSLKVSRRTSTTLWDSTILFQSSSGNQGGGQTWHCHIQTPPSARLLLRDPRSHPFVDQEKRLEPVDMHYADQVTDQIVYHLPANLAVEGAPQDAKIPWNKSAVLVTKTVPATGQVTIARQFARGFTTVKAEDYQDLRSFYQKVASADQQQLVLTSSTASKGN